MWLLCVALPNSTGRWHWERLMRVQLLQVLLWLPTALLSLCVVAMVKLG
jgi:hypothetical protein